jgi:hypothetical protein
MSYFCTIFCGNAAKETPMKIRVALGGLIAVLLLSGGVQGDDKSGWTKYTSKKGGFSVLMPGTPREDTKTVKTPYDTFEQTTMQFLDRSKGFAYAIDFTELPEDMLKGISVDDFLDIECDVYVKEGKGKLLNQKHITLGRLPGREIEEELFGGKAISRTRIFLVEGRVYHVTVVMPRNRADSKTMNRYLDSFRLEKTK